MGVRSEFVDVVGQAVKPCWSGGGMSKPVCFWDFEEGGGFFEVSEVVVCLCGGAGWRGRELGFLNVLVFSSSLSLFISSASMRTKPSS